MRLSLLVFLIFLTASVPVYLLVRNSEAINLFANIAQFTGLAFAGFQFLRARTVVSHPECRKACLLFFFGFCFWAFGQLLVLYSEILLRRISTGTISSVYFLIGYSFITAALYTLARLSLAGIGKEDSRRTVLFACILIVIIAAFLEKPLSAPHLAATSTILNLVYAIFDLIVLGLSFLLLQFARITRTPHAIKAYALLLSGFVLIAISNFSGMDAGFGTLLYHVLDLLYFSSYFLISIAGSILEKSLPSGIDTGSGNK